MAEPLWYYEDAGKPAGPVSEAALGEAIRLGRLPPGARVWTAGMGGWVPWETIPSLAAPPPAPAPSAPAPGGWSPPAAPPSGPGWSPPSREAVAASAAGLFPRAPLLPRLLAAFVDTAVGAGPLAVGILLFEQVSDGNWSGGATATAAGMALVASGAWAIWYSLTKDGRLGGQSVGKKMVGLMVIHLPTRQPCTRGQSALRAVVHTVLNLIPYVGWLVEPIAVLVAKGGRRVGDQAAATQVILASDYRAPR